MGEINSSEKQQQLCKESKQLFWNLNKDYKDDLIRSQKNGDYST